MIDRKIKKNIIIKKIQQNNDKIVKIIVCINDDMYDIKYEFYSIEECNNMYSCYIQYLSNGRLIDVEEIDYNIYELIECITDNDNIEFIKVVYSDMNVNIYE